MKCLFYLFSLLLGLTGCATTPLHKAVSVQDWQQVVSLVGHGADVNSLDWRGQTPLIVASQNGDFVIGKFLIHKGADPNFEMPDGETALSQSLYYLNYAFVNMLIQEGANIDSISNNCSIITHFISYDKPGIAKLLFEKGVSINCRDRFGTTPLMCTVSFNKMDLFYYLVGKGADVHARDQDGMNALLLASYIGDLDTLKELIRLGIDVNSQNNEGWTALHYAAYYGYYDTTIILVESGADLNILDAAGHSPIFFAKTYKQYAIEQYLLSKGAAH